MSHSTSISIPENVQPALFLLQEEVAKVEKALLDLQKKKHEVLQQKFSTGIENLGLLANKINALTSNLESEILNFKETAIEVNHIYHTIQDSPGLKLLEGDKSTITSWKPLNVLQIKNLALSLPVVTMREAQFFLTLKAVNPMEINV